MIPIMTCVTTVVFFLPPLSFSHRNNQRSIPFVYLLHLVVQGDAGCLFSGVLVAEVFME